MSDRQHKLDGTAQSGDIRQGLLVDDLRQSQQKLRLAVRGDLRRANVTEKPCHFRLTKVVKNFVSRPVLLALLPIDGWKEASR